MKDTKAVGLFRQFIEVHFPAVDSRRAESPANAKTGGCDGNSGQGCGCGFYYQSTSAVDMWFGFGAPFSQKSIDESMHEVNYPGERK